MEMQELKYLIDNVEEQAQTKKKYFDYMLDFGRVSTIVKISEN